MQYKMAGDVRIDHDRSSSEDALFVANCVVLLSSVLSSSSAVVIKIVRSGINVNSPPHFQRHRCEQVLNHIVSRPLASLLIYNYVKREHVRLRSGVQARLDWGLCSVFVVSRFGRLTACGKFSFVLVPVAICVELRRFKDSREMGHLIFRNRSRFRNRLPK